MTKYQSFRDLADQIRAQNPLPSSLQKQPPCTLLPYPNPPDNHKRNKTNAHDPMPPAIPTAPCPPPQPLSAHFTSHKHYTLNTAPARHDQHCSLPRRRVADTTSGRCDWPVVHCPHTAQLKDDSWNDRRANGRGRGVATVSRPGDASGHSLAVALGAGRGAVLCCAVLC